MSTRFIGNARGVVLTCNNGDVAIGQTPALDSDGKPLVRKNGSPVYEYTFPAKCGEKLTTGHAYPKLIRSYAQTQKWLTVEIDGKKRDFCPAHAPERAKQIKERKAEAKRIADEKRVARETAEAERRGAWLEKQRVWKAKREEKAARAAAWHAKRAAKRAAAEATGSP